MLTSLMEYQATCLGLLVDQDEGFDFNKIAKGMTEEGRPDVDFCDVIAKKLINCSELYYLLTA